MQALLGSQCSHHSLWRIAHNSCNINGGIHKVCCYSWIRGMIQTSVQHSSNIIFSSQSPFSFLKLTTIDLILFDLQYIVRTGILPVPQDLYLQHTRTYWISRRLIKWIVWQMQTSLAAIPRSQQVAYLMSCAIIAIYSCLQPITMAAIW